jgi:hypothetical protein
MANIYKKSTKTSFQKLLFAALVCLLSQGHMQASKEKKAPAVYLIHQQANSTCFLSPQYNLMQIDDFLINFNNEFHKIPDKYWVNKRIWLGREFEYVVIWNDAFESMFTDKYPHLKKFLEDGIENGPVSPHMYKQDGTAIYNKGKAGWLTVVALPHFFSDYNFINKHYEGLDIIPDLNLLVPYFKDKDGKYSIYDKKNDSLIIKNYKDDSLALKEPMLKTFKIKVPVWGEYPNGKKILGAEKIIFDSGANCLSYDYQGEKYSFYVIGLYKLMLLRLGLDFNNNVIGKEHRLYPIFKEIHAVFNEKPKKNFWSDRYLNKEQFIEYHLANLLKENENLFKKAKAVVDFVFEDYKTYKLVTSMTRKKELFKDQNGKKPYDWDVLKDYLPGPEQVVAMSMVQSARLLWYGALSPEAFYEETMEENTNLSKIKGVNEKWSFEYFKKCAYNTNNDLKGKRSFISVWQKIIKAFNKTIKNISRKNFISFDGHGCILSFHPYVIHLQENIAKNCGQKCDINLLKDLKFAGIESYLGSELPTFYKKQEGAVLPDFYDMTSKKKDHNGK